MYDLFFPTSMAVWVNDICQWISPQVTNISKVEFYIYLYLYNISLKALTPESITWGGGVQVNYKKIEYTPNSLWKKNILSTHHVTLEYKYQILLIPTSTKKNKRSINLNRTVVKNYANYKSSKQKRKMKWNSKTYIIRNTK